MGYYGSDAKYSYYEGCSTGGAQGFGLVQLHPNDFDGIVAGCPGAYYSHLAVSFLYNAKISLGDANRSVDQLEYAFAQAILHCDTLDGAVNGLISDPEACGFDPLSLLRGFDTIDLCFSESQAMALERIYHGTTDPISGDTLYRKFFLDLNFICSFKLKGS